MGRGDKRTEWKNAIFIFKKNVVVAVPTEKRNIYRRSHILTNGPRARDNISSSDVRLLLFVHARVYGMQFNVVYDNDRRKSHIFRKFFLRQPQKLSKYFLLYIYIYIIHVCLCMCVCV